ncbi:Asparagine-rich zinc finger protein AZF1 [Paramyrothecium foliicola]|nr:Asparagine-rich zinc finger protein AZF1 [Paramyrothecium foliicola]
MPYYGITGPYSTSVTTVATPQSIPAPHYPTHNSYSYAPYQSVTSAALGSPFKQDYADRANTRHHVMEGIEHETTRTPTTYSRDVKTSEDFAARSPSTRSGSVSSTTKSTATNPTANSKRITLNETYNPSHQVNFETKVDQLMKIIQQSDKRPNRQATPVQTPKSDMNTDAHSPASPGSVASTQNEQESRKKYVCNGPNCNKRFSQKTHLQIHARTHSGEKPFRCDHQGCGLTFSQKGNLRTHQRRHTGDKPYSCSVCGKGFAQKGNVRSHEETHKQLKPYKCRLDNCNKDFSQLGNMKVRPFLRTCYFRSANVFQTHQNSYHAESLAKLTDTFIKYAGAEEIPAEHRDMFEYFKEHYKNSNKGIKGRGKDRTITKTRSKADHKKTPPRASATSQYQQPSPQTQQRGSGYPMVQGPSTMMAHMPRSHQSNPYMFASEQEQHANASHMLYEDEHSRQMAFTERLY